MPTEDAEEPEENESVEEGTESEDEEQAIIEGNKEYGPAYEVDDDAISEEDEEEFIEDATE